VAVPPSTDPEVGTERQLRLARLLRHRVEHGSLVVPVTGASMGRSIRDGSVVEVVTTLRSPRRGEVWAFVDAGGTVLVHRYRSRVGDVLWFRGDGNRADDRPVPSDALVGRVAAVRADGRRRVLGKLDRCCGRVRLDLRSVRRELHKVLAVAMAHRVRSRRRRSETG
jgi:hypothetical protein